MTPIEQAIEALESAVAWREGGREKARAALSALRGVEQQPVASLNVKRTASEARLSFGPERAGLDLPSGDYMLYATPPPAPVGEPPKRLSEAEILNLDPHPHVMFDQQRVDFARAIKAQVLRRAGGGV